MGRELPRKYLRYIRTPRHDFEHETTSADRFYDRAAALGSYAVAVGIRLARLVFGAIIRTLATCKRAAIKWKHLKNQKNN